MGRLRYIDAKPRDYDFGTWSDDWTHWTACRCEECGKVVVGNSGEEQHRYVGGSGCDGWLIFDPPMINCAYPIDLDRMEGVEEAARALVNLPLCVVCIEDGYFLALTGGGMDLSWQIAEGYMRLGYLPPVHFTHLPRMAGKQLGARNRWILAGCHRALLVKKKQVGWGLKRLREVREWMKGGQNET